MQSTSDKVEGMTSDRTARTITPAPSQSGAAQLQDRAIADLQFIRQTMATATAFTALSGVAFMVIGMGALVTGVVAQRLGDPLLQVLAWTADAALSVCLSTAFSIRKARCAGQSLISSAFRKFLAGLVPAIFAGAVLTALVVRSEAYELLPPLWLLLYGCGLVAAGSFSIAVVPLMGASFLVLGAVSAVAPAAWGGTLLVLGFAGLHCGFGWVIARRHGG